MAREDSRSGSSRERGAERRGVEGDDVGAGRLRRRALVVGGAGLAIVVPALAGLGVRRLRRTSREVPQLDLDIELDGTLPVRTVVVLGDSSSAGFRLTSAEQAAARRIARALVLRDGRATRVRSVARNGATTVDVLAEQADTAADADVVLIGVGANDAKDRLPSADVAAALAGLLARVREIAAPEARIVLIGCPDLSVAPGLPLLVRLALRPHMRRVARLQERAAAEAGIALVPLPRAVLSADVFADDGFHPGPLGHERIAGRVLTLL